MSPKLFLPQRDSPPSESLYSLLPRPFFRLFGLGLDIIYNFLGICSLVYIPLNFFFSIGKENVYPSDYQSIIGKELSFKPYPDG